MVVIVEGLTDDVVPDVCPVASQFSVGHGYVAANQCARDVGCEALFPPGQTVRSLCAVGGSNGSEPEIGTMVRSPTGYPIQSPYLAMANRQAELMMRIASEFRLHARKPQ